MYEEKESESDVLNKERSAEQIGATQHVGQAETHPPDSGDSTGGEFVMKAGDAKKNFGGAVSLMSGYGIDTSSGNIDIQTPNGGADGVSGSLTFSSGVTPKGDSGDISIGTGESSSTVAQENAGNIWVTVSATNAATRWAMTVTANALSSALLLLYCSVPANGTV